VSERRSHLYLIGLILAALVGVALLVVPASPVHKEPTLGLDLQGGLEVILEASPPPGRPLRSNDLDRSVTIIRNRIDKLGVSEPIVTKQAANQISIQLAGIKDTQRAYDLIGKTAVLAFYDLEADLVPPSISTGFPVANDKLYDLLVGQQAEVKAKGGTKFWLFDKKTKKIAAGPLPSADALEKTKAYGQLGTKNARIFGVPKNRVVITCGGGGAVVCPGVNVERPTATYYYLFKTTVNDPKADAEHPIPEMTGDDLRLSGTRSDFDPNTGEPIVLMQFTKDGREKFGDITRDLAQRGRFKSSTGQEQFQHFAIVLDNEIRSYPSIDFNENPNGIQGSNGAQITGMAGLNEAKDLAIVLQTGALPVTFNTLEATEISATLGADSLRQAWKAALAGLALVAIFLLVVYRFLGLVAVIGLGIYAAFLYAAILIFNVTLTLPGFAGMILTIGVAADANIVIFERIKEEVRAGKSVRAAIAAGYGKGFHTIIDANMVTAITALVLFALASAGVKGFALMLLIGTGISLITAVAATRAMLGLLAGFRWFDSPRFMGAAGAQSARWIQIDFIGRRNLWFAISGTVLAIAAGSLAVKGLNLGIDFKGGTQIAMTTPQPVSISDVRAQAKRFGEANAVIQGRGTQVGTEQYRDFQIRTEALDRAKQNELTTALKSRFQAETSVNTVSASFGRQIARGAILAIIFSLLLVVLYITIRFQYKFAIAVIVALLHDVVIAVGIYSLVGREVTTSTVAAILTVLGYSIYDTIIILDRVRENIPLMRRASFARIANVSLWETIRRSLATTFITLLPIGALFVFGGATLKDFAFALLVGIGSGAYSSIFIAAPLVAVLKEREPEYERRKDVVATDEEVLEEAEEAAAEAPVPALAPVTAGERAVASGSGDGSKRERRRQRRRTRPHGRAR
jgi:SecD/SecF fusion protein